MAQGSECTHEQLLPHSGSSYPLTSPRIHLTQHTHSPGPICRAPAPPPTCCLFRMCSTEASSSSWQLLCLRGTLPPPAAPVPQRQLEGVEPVVHRCMLWLLTNTPLGVPPLLAAAAAPPSGCCCCCAGDSRRLPAPGSCSTSSCRTAQPRRWRLNVVGRGGLRAGRAQQENSGGGGIAQMRK